LTKAGKKKERKEGKNILQQQHKEIRTMHMCETKTTSQGKLKVVIIHKMNWPNLMSVMEFVN